MLLTLSSWLGLPSRAATPRPLLLRIGEPGIARTVEVQARWHVAGGLVAATRRLYVSDGVCLLAWSRDARAVDLEIPHVDGPLRAHVLAQHYQGEVIELC